MTQYVVYREVGYAVEADNAEAAVIKFLSTPTDQYEQVYTGDVQEEVWNVDADQCENC
ncbi:hypothetical protein BH20CHL4_BH20CHL4_12860 [soil metagenome]